jgi:hypothetical protein
MRAYSTVKFRKIGASSAQRWAPGAAGEAAMRGLARRANCALPASLAALAGGGA